jgi:hypothetical protein
MALGNSVLSNRATLYFIFFLSIVYLFFLLLNYDFPSVFFFGLVGLVSSFFTRNMIVILFISLMITIILNVGGLLGEIPMFGNTTKIVIIEDGDKVDYSMENIENIEEEEQEEQEESNEITYGPTNQPITLLSKPVEDSAVNYQSSIMLSNNSPNFDETPIENVPMNMNDNGNFGYDFSNPFSKFDQDCNVSDKYSCF